MNIAGLFRRTAVAVAIVLILASCGGDPVDVEAADGPAQEGSVEGESAQASQPVSTTEPVELPETETETEAETEPVEPADPPVESEPVSPTDPEDRDPEDPAFEGPAPGADEGGVDEGLPPVEGGGEPVVIDGWIRTTSAAELLDPRIAQPQELFVDGNNVVVRYMNGAEPCSLARVTVTEGPDQVEVLLETGAHPNAAAMSCIALVSGYEILTPLQNPLGERSLIAIASGAQPELEEEDPFAGAVFPTDHYIGLTLEEAQAIADVEGRPLRVSVLEGEALAGTMDYSPTRVNVEIASGVIVAASSG